MAEQCARARARGLAAPELAAQLHADAFTLEAARLLVALLKRKPNSTLSWRTPATKRSK